LNLTLTLTSVDAGQLAEYRLQQEKVISEDLSDSIVVEKRNAAELQQQILREKQLTLNAEEETDRLRRALDTARRDLEVERERLVAAS
jgi:hypothetical protein